MRHAQLHTESALTKIFNSRNVDIFRISKFNIHFLGIRKDSLGITWDHLIGCLVDFVARHVGGHHSEYWCDRGPSVELRL